MVDLTYREHEIKVYNNLSFLISYGVLTQDFGTYREQARDATDEERECWEIFDKQTPHFKEILVSKDLDLYNTNSFQKDKLSTEAHTRWLENSIENTLWINDNDIKALYRFEEWPNNDGEWKLEFYEFL